MEVDQWKKRRGIHRHFRTDQKMDWNWIQRTERGINKEKKLVFLKGNITFLYIFGSIFKRYQNMIHTILQI